MKLLNLTGSTFLCLPPHHRRRNGNGVHIQALDLQGVFCSCPGGMTDQVAGFGLLSRRNGNGYVRGQMDEVSTDSQSVIRSACLLWAAADSPLLPGSSGGRDTAPSTDNQITARIWTRLVMIHHQ